MPIIALITDWNKQDYYLGAVKGYILSQSNDVNIVDISNNISNFNVFQAAFVLKSCFDNFPEKTVFIIGVESVNESNKYLCFMYSNKYILCSDNGFFSVFTNDKPQSVLELESITTTFPELNIFAKYACEIVNEKLPENLNSSSNYKTFNVFKPIYSEKFITGHAIYIDGYGNVITNINKTDFYKFCENKKYKITFIKNDNLVEQISQNYNDNNDFTIIFNSLGLLEISIYKQSLAQLLDVKINSNIRIDIL